MASGSPEGRKTRVSRESGAVQSLYMALIGDFPEEVSNL